MSEAFTSDGVSRPNQPDQLSAIVVSVPTSIGANARVSVLNTLAVAVGIPGLDHNAAYSQSYITQRLNDISAKVNTLAGSAVCPIFTSIDYNAFTSVVSNIAAKMATLP